MISYILSFAWGLCVLVALIGWGAVINQIIFPKYLVDWAQKAAWGIALSIFIGGLLNLGGIISPLVVLTYLVLGFICGIINFFKQSLLKNNKFFIIECKTNIQKHWITLIIVFFAFCLILFHYASWVSVSMFNLHDDYHAYFVFPNKMLQSGSLGADPFSERKIVASLGGQSFLQTLILTVLSEENLHIIDPGLGTIITAGILWGYFNEESSEPSSQIAVIKAALPITFFLLIPPPVVNVTSVVIPLALFLSFFRLLNWSGLQNQKITNNAFIVALNVAAICSLKSSLIIPCLLFFILSYLFYIVKSKFAHRIICEFFIALFMIIIFLLPWMISMYKSSGTLLFPILGKGYHRSAYGLPYWEPLTADRSLEILTNAIIIPEFIVLIVLGILIITLRLKKPVLRTTFTSFILSNLIGILILALLTEGFYIERYIFSFVYAAILIEIAIVSDSLSLNTRKYLHLRRFVVISTACILLTVFWQTPQLIYSKYMSHTKFGLSGMNMIPNEAINQYIKVQNSIPEGETILTRLSMPFLLNFKRNNILIADFPGGASLPPGMPLFKGSDALAGYLLSNGIRYVAYSYKDEANFSRDIYGSRLEPHNNSMVKSHASFTFDFQENLLQLSKTKNKIYDDGEIFVIDIYGN